MWIFRDDDLPPLMGNAELGRSLPAGSDDPGRFWSGDELDLRGARLGGELSVHVTVAEMSRFEPRTVDERKAP